MIEFSENSISIVNYITLMESTHIAHKPDY